MALIETLLNKRFLLKSMALTDLDGVGPARRNALEEAGYTDFETIADAGHEQLAEDIDVPEDTALEFVVQSQNLVESDDSEEEQDDAEEDLEEDEPLPGDLVDSSENVDEDTSEESLTEDADEVYELVINLETDVHYDAYIMALLSAYERRHNSHQPTLDAINEVLDDARYNTGEVSHELTSFELNSMHAAVSQQATEYKGQNMIDHMDAMRDVLEQVNEVREAELF